MDQKEVDKMLKETRKNSLVGLVISQGGQLNYDEMVVYDSKAAIPSYLIVYKCP